MFHGSNQALVSIGCLLQLVPFQGLMPKNELTTNKIWWLDTGCLLLCYMCSVEMGVGGCQVGIHAYTCICMRIHAYAWIYVEMMLGNALVCPNTFAYLQVCWLIGISPMSMYAYVYVWIDASVHDK